MSRLTDDELAKINRRFAGADHEEVESMVAEIRQHRASRMAHRERVRAVVEGELSKCGIQPASNFRQVRDDGVFSGRVADEISGLSDGDAPGSPADLRRAPEAQVVSSPADDSTDLTEDDLTDERLETVEAGVWHRSPNIDEMQRMVAEIRRHRAAVRADRERVRAAVVTAVDATAVENVDGGRSSWTGKFVDAIADHVADALASPAPATIAVSVLQRATEGRMPVSIDDRERVRSAVRSAALSVQNPTLVDLETARAIADRAAERLSGSDSAPPPSDSYCDRCGDRLMFSARLRGNGLCGSCTRDSAGQPPSEAARGAVLNDDELAELIDIRRSVSCIAMSCSDRSSYAPQLALLDRIIAAHGKAL